MIEATRAALTWLDGEGECPFPEVTENGEPPLIFNELAAEYVLGEQPNPR